MRFELKLHAVDGCNRSGFLSRHNGYDRPCYEQTGCRSVVQSSQSVSAIICDSDEQILVFKDLDVYSIVGAQCIPGSLFDQCSETRHHEDGRAKAERLAGFIFSSPAPLAGGHHEDTVKSCISPASFGNASKRAIRNSAQKPTQRGSLCSAVPIRRIRSWRMSL
jgi:hypothetical protein